MHHAFLDRWSDLDSPIHRLDPRSKIVAFTAIILIVISVPPAEPATLLLLWPGIVVLHAVSRVPARWTAKRCLTIMPFVLMAAGLMLVTGESGVHDRAGAGTPLDFRQLAALSITLKALAAMALLTLLTSTDRFQRLLEGMRRLGMPPLVGVLSAWMYRYAFILSDEVMRTSRARRSRTPGRLRTGRVRTFGNQAATVFLRSWHRSRTVYQAMCSRGFTGELPLTGEMKAAPGDLLFALLVPAVFLAVRVWA